MKLLQIETNLLVISDSELPLNKFRTVKDILNSVEPQSFNEARTPRLERGKRETPRWHMDVPPGGASQKKYLAKILMAPIVIGGLLAGGCTVIQVNNLEAEKGHPCPADYSSRSPSYSKRSSCTSEYF